MDTSRENSKRIAKNTILLYARMAVTMLVTLFTSRVILQTLGISDYGVYNVVAGFVTMFSFFTSSLSSAISRFLTFNLGKGDVNKLSVTFSTSMNVMLVISLLVLILSESVGPWFLNSYLNIPDDRMNAANWVLQFSIISFIVGLISVPYNASIISHEKMSVYAYVSIFEVILKLIIVYMIMVSPFDKLISYGFLLSIVSIIIRFVYGLYCKRHFIECTYHFVYDKKLLKEMTSYAGWNLFGTGAYLFNTQGVNILTNIFFGVTFNAARGISNQVEGAIRQFVTNFTTALNPQIIKSYASNNIEYMNNLVCKGAIYSYYLMLIISVPILFEADIILHLWLGIVPDNAAIFLQLAIVGNLADILGNSMANAAWATGNIKKYYIYVGGVGCLVFPISWVLFLFGFPSESAYYVFIFIYVILIFIKLWILKGLLKFPIKKYITEVLARIIPVTMFSIVIPATVCFTMPESITRLIICILMGVISTVIVIYVFGIGKLERKMINNRVLKFIARI